MSDIVEILCIGSDPHLLESRCLVLQSAGHKTTSLATSEALHALPTKTFDILIISASVSEEDRAALAEVATGTAQIIQLKGFISPNELLALVYADGT